MESSSPRLRADPAAPSPQTLAQRVGRFSSATLISRVLGYFRDASVAYFFGGTFYTDAFYTAFRIANLLRRLLGEGALASSFVPVFSDSLRNEPREKTQEFLDSLFSALLVVLLALTLGGILCAPWIARWVAPGFAGSPEKFRLTVLLTRWTFPFFLFISLAALASGVLNSLKHFFLPAAAPAMLSLAQLGYLFILIPGMAHFFGKIPREELLLGLAVAAVAGGLAHFLVQVPLLWKEGFRFRWSPRWSHPRSTQVLKLMGPAVIGLSVDQVNAFVDTLCATFLAEGSVTALYNSNRLMQLPLALFGIAIASVSLPALAAHKADNDLGKFAETVNDSLRMVVFTVLPASLGLLALAWPAVQTLFEHGRFTWAATFLTVRALQGYCLGLVAYAAVKVLANAFYALQEPKVPVRVAAVSMGLNALLSVALMFPFGVGGLALATAVSSWVNAIWLFLALRKRVRGSGGLKLEALPGRNLIRTVFKTLLASAAMFLCARFVLHHGPQKARWQVLMGVPGGLAVFLASARLLKMEEVRSVWHMAGLPGLTPGETEG